MYTFLSPTTRLALRDLPAAFADPQLQFFALLHPAGVLSGIGMFGTGWLLARRAGSDRAKHGWTLLATIAAAILIGLAVPWPGTIGGRPLLRFPG